MADAASGFGVRSLARCSVSSSPRAASTRAANSEKCGSTALSLIWQFALGSVSMMVGAAILTALYDHFIEKRVLV